MSTAFKSDPFARDAQVLVIAASGADVSAGELLHQIGYHADTVDNPYAGLVLLLNNRMHYRAAVLSLQGLYREELLVIKTIREQLPHLELWLTHTDGRQAALAESVALGATGLVSEEGLHRFEGIDDQPTPLLQRGPQISSDAIGDQLESPSQHAMPSDANFAVDLSGPDDSTAPPDDANSNDKVDHLMSAPSYSKRSVARQHSIDEDPHDIDPILSADELRALLQEQPLPPESR